MQALSLTLQAMGQDDENFSRYTPLAVHLVKDFFLNHDSKDVQLLVACCVADILRVFAPEAPYKEPEQIKVSRSFIQLEALLTPLPSFVLGNLRISNSSAKRTERSKGSSIQALLLPSREPRIRKELQHVL